MEFEDREDSIREAMAGGGAGLRREVVVNGAMVP